MAEWCIRAKSRARRFRFEGRLTVLCAALLVALAGSPHLLAQEPRAGAVKGTVADTSDGVLPGVVVSAIAHDGRTIGTMVTGGTCEFAFDQLPAGPIDLSFHLDGFEDAKVKVTIQPAAPGTADRTITVTQQLKLKGLTETVIVRADPPPPPPRPRPVLKPVAPHDPSAVCGPALAEGAVVSTATVLSERTDGGRGLFGARDELLIEGGANANINVGDNFIVRRRYATPLLDRKRKPVMGEHSAGLVQIVSVDDDSSTAVVVYSCDEVMSGDYLVRFEPEPPNVPEPIGTPSFDAAARILFADAGQSVGIPNRMLVIDRGALHGVEAGHRFTLFRRSRFGQTRPVVIGEAVVVTTRRETATIRVEAASDVVFLGMEGDWAAPQRPSQRASQ
jgi:hypothetical protein